MDFSKYNSLSVSFYLYKKSGEHDFCQATPDSILWCFSINGSYWTCHLNGIVIVCVRLCLRITMPTWNTSKQRRLLLPMTMYQPYRHRFTSNGNKCAYTALKALFLNLIQVLYTALRQHTSLCMDCNLNHRTSLSWRMRLFLLFAKVQQVFLTDQ